MILKIKKCIIYSSERKKMENLRMIFETIYTIALPFFILSTMVGVGLSLTLKQIYEPLKNKELVIKVLILNFVISPIIAITLTKVFNLDPGVSIAMIIISMAAGAPFLPKLSNLAKEDDGKAIGIMILLMVVTIFYLPLVLPLVEKGATISGLELAKPLLIMMLLPLGLSLLFRHYKPTIASKISKKLKKISGLLMICVAGTMILLNISSVPQIFGIDLIALTIFMLLILISGYIIGGKERDMVMLASGQRNNAAIMLIVINNFNEYPLAIISVVVIGIYGFLVMVPLARAIGKRKENLKSAS
jgi:BASS family bile acid:Na+ symporter